MGDRVLAADIELLPASTLRDVVDVLVQLIEAAGALIIFAGAVIAFVRFLRTGVGMQRSAREFATIRLSLGRFLVLGLEFQLAGDVLRTAISPSFEEIGQLAAIATIRTALNYFLSREIARERAEIEDPTVPQVAPP
jgi:uncharacterized membrane protein